MKCPNPICGREVNDAPTFCPYCGAQMGSMRTAGGRMGDAQGVSNRSDRTFHEDFRSQTAVRSRCGRVPLPALIAGGVVVAFVAVFVMFQGLGIGSAPSLPDPFEGTIEVVIEDAINSDLTVQDGRSTWTVEDPASGEPPLEVSATLNLVAAESGSGVYDYDMEGVAWGDLSTSTAEEIDSAFGSSISDALLPQSQAQLILPAGAAEGDIVGTWGVRYEEGGLSIPVYPYLEDGSMSVINEMTLDVKRDGTFSLIVAFDLVGGEGPSAPEGAGMRGEAAVEHEESYIDQLNEDAGLIEYAIVCEGSWFVRDTQSLTFLPKTAYWIVNTVSSEPESISDSIPSVYVSVRPSPSAGDVSAASAQTVTSHTGFSR